MNKDKDKDKYFKHLDHQDWTTIVVNKNKDKEKVDLKKKVIDSKANKIEKQVEEDDLKHKKITSELRQLIIKGRVANKLTQKELSQKCNFPVHIINDIETGKAIYNHIQINKIKRILKV